MYTPKHDDEYTVYCVHKNNVCFFNALVVYTHNGLINL